MKAKILSIILLLFSMSVVGVENAQTSTFRVHLHRFFNDAEYQKSHISFPYTFIHPESEDEEAILISEEITSREWQFMKGPDNFCCSENCFDLIIYDSFEKKHEDSGERVLSFEGVENGIYELLYFKLINNEWYLIKHESLSN